MTTILGEITKLILDNIEVIILAAVPLGALIAFIGKKINNRIIDVADDTLESMKQLKAELMKLQNELLKTQEEVRKLELFLKLKINTLEVELLN